MLRTVPSLFNAETLKSFEEQVTTAYSRVALDDGAHQTYTDFIQRERAVMRT